MTTQPAVPASAKTTLVKDVGVSLKSVASIAGVAHGPGEVSGPAVAVSVSITNGTSKPFDLSAVTVDVSDAKGTPGSPLTGAPASPFRADLLAHGDAATAVYVFSIPAGRHGPLHITVGYSAAAPALFLVPIK